jgi:hypothetical protein
MPNLQNSSAVPHGGKSGSTYHVYVLEVLGGAEKEVYVGQSWYEPEVRREQHINGRWKAKVFKKLGPAAVGPLLTDLLPELAPLRTKAAALAAEAYVAAVLRDAGYRVHGGH